MNLPDLRAAPAPTDLLKPTRSAMSIFANSNNISISGGAFTSIAGDYHSYFGASEGEKGELMNILYEKSH